MLYLKVVCASARSEPTKGVHFPCFRLHAQSYECYISRQVIYHKASCHLSPFVGVVYLCQDLSLNTALKCSL